MADGRAQQNPEQFLAGNPFIPNDFRLVHPNYPPPTADTRMGRFHAGLSGQTPNFAPPFTEMQHSLQPINPYTYNTNRQLGFATNQGSIEQQITTFPNTNSVAGFRPSGSIPPSYGGRQTSTQFPGGPTAFVPGGEPSKFVAPGSHLMSSWVPGAPRGMGTNSANLPPPPGAATVAQSDKTWVERFVQERHIVKTGKDQISGLKICEARELLRKWFCLTTELINERNKLIECITADKSEWDKQLHEAEQKKAKIVEIEAIFANPEFVEKLGKQISTRRKKRVSQRTRRKERISERKESEERRSMLHKKIDAWRERSIAKEEASRKAALLKSEAGGVLGEVRRKLSETTKGLELLKSLKKLRDIRKQEAERKGVYRRPTEGENKYFSERLEFMEKLMTRRKALYEVEQEALEVMLTEEEEEKYRKKREERRIQQDLFKARDPMEDFYDYYNQADRSLQSLLQIRHQWDMFLVPESVPGASRVPDGWVPPAEPSSALWASMVKRDETMKSPNYTAHELDRKEEGNSVCIVEQ